jgi:hypothetical protein
MSIIKTNSARRGQLDHFEPDNSLDPYDQRRLRGHLEQIDYAAFAANKAVMGASPGAVDLGAVQRLAVATAQARAGWIKAALDAAASGHVPSDEVVAELARRRTAFDELCAAYDGLRRMIERGYVEYHPGR